MGDVAIVAVAHVNDVAPRRTVKEARKARVLRPCDSGHSFASPVPGTIPHCLNPGRPCGPRGLRVLWFGLAGGFGFLVIDRKRTASAAEESAAIGGEFQFALVLGFDA